MTRDEFPPFCDTKSYVNDEIIIDYGATGISPPFFIGILIGVLGIIVFFTRVIPVASLFFAGRLLFCGLFSVIAFIILFRDMKKDTLEITQNALIIHRVLHRAVVLRKDTIATVEIRHNTPPFPLWLQKVLIFLVIPASSAGVIYGEYLQLVSGEITSSSFFVHLGFNISIVMFFLTIYYHSRVRSYYPSVLVISTTTKKLAGIYGENMDEIRRRLGKSV